MKNKFLLLTWLLAVPLLWGGCEKPLFKTDKASIAQPDELPPITTTGEGTFACKINGVNWQRCGGNLEEVAFLESGTRFIRFFSWLVGDEAVKGLMIRFYIAYIR